MARILTYDVPDGDIEIHIGGEIYYAVGTIPALDFPKLIGVVGRIAKHAEAGGADGADTEAEVTEQIGMLTEAISYCLVPESRERLVAAISNGAESPVPFPVLIRLLNDLMSEYSLAGDDDEDAAEPGEGVRPTPPTPDSQATS